MVAWRRHLGYARDALAFLFLVMAIIGESIVRARSVVLYAALLGGTFIVPRFGMFLVACLLCWAYKARVTGDPRLGLPRWRV